MFIIKAQIALELLYQKSLSEFALPRNPVGSNFGPIRRKQSAKSGLMDQRHSPTTDRLPKVSRSRTSEIDGQ